MVRTKEGSVLTSGDKHFFRCSVCGNDSFKTVYSFGSIPNKQTVSVCKNCGTVCLNPRWDEERYQEYYQNDYYGKWQPKIDLDKEESSNIITNSRAIKMFDDLRPLLNEGDKILEIGCGQGYNLAKFKEHGFNDLLGLDPSPDCCKLVEKLGIRCLNKTLSTYRPNPSEKFDCIILSGVLEHFVEPDKALEMVNHLLKPGGILYIGVPDLYWFSKTYTQFGLPHTFYFSKVTLESLLNSNGFIVERYFETPSSQAEMELVARKSDEKLTSITGNTVEYERALSYLRKDKLEYIRNAIRRRVNGLVIMVFHEDTILAVRAHLSNLRGFIKGAR